MRKLDRVAEAIMAFEGWRPGTDQEASRSYRNSNPGNLRSGVGEIRKDDGFAVFGSWEDGVHALVWDLQVKCSGLSKACLPSGSRLKKTHNLYDLFMVYAPTDDGNHPRQYAEFVAERARINPNDPIAKILVED